MDFGSLRGLPYKLPSCGLKKSASQTIPSGIGVLVSFDLESWDNDNLHDNTVNNARITVRNTGLWLVGYNLAWSANSVGIRRIQIIKNGLSDSQYLDERVPSANNYLMGGSYVMRLAANDFINLIAFQNSGVDLTLTFVSAVEALFFACYLGFEV